MANGNMQTSTLMFSSVFISFKVTMQKLITLILVVFINLAIVVAQDKRSELTTDPRGINNGKTIRHITFVIKDIFDQPDPGSFYRTANSLKISTREAVVQRELTFKEGDTYQQFVINESERNLRNLGYLTDVTIIPKADGNVVDIEVSVRDTWTFIPVFGYSSGTGKNTTTLGLSESDIWGYGKKTGVMYQSQDSSRDSISAVYNDPRVWGSSNELITGLFHRNDGDRGYVEFGHPYRTLLDDNFWMTSFDLGDTVGRLFQNGDERYIYQQRNTDVDLRYGFATGNPEVLRRRYAFGYQFIHNDFAQATLKDYHDLDLDPNIVSNDPSLLATDRKYSGIILSYETIEPRYIPMSYIDRFERVEDYNLGDDFLMNATFAPTFLGSDSSAVLLNINRAHGWQINPKAFIRGEIGCATRIQSGDFQNTLAHSEIKYYHVFDPGFIKDFYIGRHTLAAALSVDYGDNLDKDRELLIGGDNAIRGYDARTFTGDKRVAFNVEDRVHLVDNWFEVMSVGAAVFFDAAGSTTDRFGNLISDEIYSDVGVGLRLAFPRSSGGKVVRIDLAFPLRDGPDGTGSFEPRIVFAGGQLFGSQLRSETVGAEKANVDIGFDR